MAQRYRNGVRRMSIDKTAVKKIMDLHDRGLLTSYEMWQEILEVSVKELNRITSELDRIDKESM